MTKEVREFIALLKAALNQKNSWGKEECKRMIDEQYIIFLEDRIDD